MSNTFAVWVLIMTVILTALFDLQPDDDQGFTWPDGEMEKWE